MGVDVEVDGLWIYFGFVDFFVVYFDVWVGVYVVGVGMGELGGVDVYVDVDGVDYVFGIFEVDVGVSVVV